MTYRLMDGRWVTEVVTTLDECIARIKAARKAKIGAAIAYHGNVVRSTLCVVHWC